MKENVGETPFGMSRMTRSAFLIPLSPGRRTEVSPVESLLGMIGVQTPATAACALDLHAAGRTDRCTVTHERGVFIGQEQFRESRLPVIHEGFSTFGTFHGFVTFGA
jgi:hypothetical protein